LAVAVPAAPMVAAALVDAGTVTVPAAPAGVAVALPPPRRFEMKKKPPTTRISASSPPPMPSASRLFPFGGVSVGGGGTTYVAP
jgi:hypothetical protein